MSEPGYQDPLIEWNRLNVENTENALVSAMYAGLIAKSPALDAYSTWLLAGTGATAALIVSNVESILPFLTSTGFKWFGALLVVSLLFGVVSKFLALQIPQIDQGNAELPSRMGLVLEKYASQVKLIEESAASRGVTLDTDIDLTRLISKYVSPFPRVMRWVVSRYMAKHSSNAQAAHLLPLRMFRWQSACLVYQLAFFIGAILTAVGFARAI